jgi:hypothetical protein
MIGFLLGAVGLIDESGGEVAGKFKNNCCY